MPQTVSDFFGRERRLAQNREAARKSRLRKKAYVQQLEASRIRLQQLEEELQQARRQGLQPHATTAPVTGAPVNPAVAAFDLEYVRWVEEQQRTLADTRTALQVMPSVCLGEARQAKGLSVSFVSLALKASVKARCVITCLSMS
jgi:hypothetical protein